MSVQHRVLNVKCFQPGEGLLCVILKLCIIFAKVRLKLYTTYVIIAPSPPGSWEVVMPRTWRRTAERMMQRRQLLQLHHRRLPDIFNILLSAPLEVGGDMSQIWPTDNIYFYRNLQYNIIYKIVWNQIFSYYVTFIIGKRWTVKENHRSGSNKATFLLFEEMLFRFNILQQVFYLKLK